MPKKKPEQPAPTPEETPFQRFDRALRRIIAVPKAKLEEREREWKRRKSS